MSGRAGGQVDDVRAAAAMYRVVGRYAEGFARGKMGADPAYAEVGRRLPTSGTLLDVGCGEGYLLAYAGQLSPGLSLIGVDHDDRRLAIARAALAGLDSVRLECGDVRDVQLPPADRVACLDVLHYLPIPQQDALLAALAGTVAPGGVLLLRDGVSDAGWRSRVTEWSERWTTFIGRHKGDGVFFRPVADTCAALEAAGMEVEVRNCSGNTPFANRLFIAQRPA